MPRLVTKEGKSPHLHSGCTPFPVTGGVLALSAAIYKMSPQDSFPRSLSLSTTPWWSVHFSVSSHKFPKEEAVAPCLLDHHCSSSNWTRVTKVEVALGNQDSTRRLMNRTESDWFGISLAVELD